MKTFFHGLVFLAGLLPLSAEPISRAQAQIYFDEGNRWFSEHNWPRAIEAYGQALTYGPSAQVYFNLGDTYAASGEPGYALFYFLKARQCKPRWAPLRQALDQLHQAYPLLPRVHTPWYGQLFQWFTWNQWVGGLSLCFWMAIWLWIADYFFLQRSRVRQLSYLGFALTFTLALLGLLNYSELKTAVVVKESPVHFAPTVSSPIRQSLPAGTLCQRAEQSNEFTYIKTKTNVEGWMPTDGVLFLHKD
jgi:tetratricopeptide (TPR) repeat protein